MPDFRTRRIVHDWFWVNKECRRCAAKTFPRSVFKPSVSALSVPIIRYHLVGRPEGWERGKMLFEFLSFSEAGPVARITFNRPGVLNALNGKTMEELGNCLGLVRNDARIRALILTGAGEKAFIAGADINELIRNSPGLAQQRSRYDQEIVSRIERLGKPSIAAINGFALGGGCELALACTMRIASKTARLGQPEVKLGIIPGCGGTQRLARLCGRAVAYELILTGDSITAEEALRIGLVSRVVEPAALIPTCEQVAADLISASFGAKPDREGCPNV